MTLPTKPHLPVTVLGHPTFTVALDSFRITDTRAQHNDTDYVFLTVLLKSGGCPTHAASLHEWVFALSTNLCN